MTLPAPPDPPAGARDPEMRAEAGPQDLLLPFGPSLVLLEEPLYRKERDVGLAGPVEIESWECRAVFVARRRAAQSLFLRLSPRGERAFAQRAEAHVLAALRKKAEGGGARGNASDSANSQLFPRCCG